MIVKDILLSSNFWVLNKKIVKSLGVECSLFLSVLAEAENIFKREWIIQESSTIEELTGMSNHIQTKCIKMLIGKGFICKQNRGIPMKRHFKLNYEKIAETLSQSQSLNSLKTSIENSSKLECENFKNLNSNSLKTIYKESIYKESNNKENINTSATPQKNDKYELIVEEILKTKTEDFRESVREYIKMRNKIKKPATAFALKNILNKLKEMTSDELKQIAILNQSTDSSHQRIYELKDSTFGKVEVEKGVFITEDEEMELLNKYDSVFYGQMTDKLSDYKLQSGKTYFNDFTALNGWVLSECIKEWRAAGKKFEK